LLLLLLALLLVAQTPVCLQVLHLCSTPATQQQG
jgi:hypothetical protein